MSEAPRVQNTENKLPATSQSNELSEIAWQKWIEKNKERDAAYRKKLIRILSLLFLLVLAAVLVWQIAVRHN